ncbi:MAG: rhodanese-related sulfurtransferase [Bacteroidetes bacterium]|nr:MAG: rhodanese-related sulfurtransferase [Bacteroidota bacterium]
MEKKYFILLYYCYTPIKNSDQFREDHHLLCLSLNLRGRIIVANEGLNGTVSGLKADCEQYMKIVKADPRFEKLEFKIEEHEDHAFAKLNVRLKNEIVHSDIQIDPNQRTGTHLEPEEFKKFKDSEDVIILDVRSNYEHKLGKFKNAITLDIEHFREFPEKMGELEQYKDKKIITYCTGGIKCEKASAYLLEQGFENVYQLHGGIIKYGIEAGGEDFEGKCYVFDNRIAADINKVNPETISRCFICNIITDRMVNCANPHCNNHVSICEKCGWEYEGACSKECQANPDKRVYDGTGYYQKELRGYNPYLNVKQKKTINP